MTCAPSQRIFLPSGSGEGLLFQSLNVSLAELQALGGTSVGSFDFAVALPPNARVLGGEFDVTQAFNAPGITSAIAAIAATTDALPTDLVNACSMRTLGLTSLSGTNIYLTRGGQTMRVTVTLAAIAFSDLTAGSFTARVFYMVSS